MDGARGFMFEGGCGIRRVRARRGRMKPPRRSEHARRRDRWRAGRALSRHQPQAARSGVRGRRLRAQPAGRHLRLGRGAFRGDARQPGGQRCAERRGDPRALRLVGRCRRRARRRAHRLHRPRLLRHRPAPAAPVLQERARAARRRGAVRGGGRGARRTHAPLRPRRRRRRPQFPLPRGLRRRLPPGHRALFQPLRLAGHAPDLPGRFHLHLRGDAARADVGARLSVRAGGGDLHRRVRRGDLEPRRLRRHEPRGIDRRLRAHFRRPPRRPSADVQRRPPARLGLDPFPARAVRALEPRQPGAARRRGRQRPLLHRFGHQAGAGERRAPRRRGERDDRPRRRARRLRGGPPGRGAAPAVGGAQLGRVVRACRAVSRARAGAVRLFPADPLAAHQPREPAPSRPLLAGRAPRDGSRRAPGGS